MSYNFINEASIIRTSPLCYYDTSKGYSSDFTTNGDTDGWDYYDGIHTYGCWSGFLFATLYGSYGLIGRTTIFYPVPAETHYFVKITMKINPVERVSLQVLPTTARLMWTTTSDSSWDTIKSHDFDIEADNDWHAYILNMGELQYWQGNINNLRLYPIYEDGRSGDEFFVKNIRIYSISTYRCDNSGCDYYSSYTHPCPGIGTKGYCKSENVSTYYTIEEGVNDNFIININGYGNETIKLDPASSATGPEIAKELTKAISRVGIGGYAEVEIDYTEDGEFIIYSGTYTTDSFVTVVDSSAARTLGFFDASGNNTSSRVDGTDPASEAETASSFKIKSFQALTLFDNDPDTFFSFDPFMYNVEGGRRDWLAGGLGASEVDIGTNTDSNASNVTQRTYNVIDNTGKTLIDFNHPFNASGRIKKIYAACTLDQGYTSVSSNPPATDYEGRDEATGCKIKILRPKRGGNLEVVHSIDIPDRDYSGSRLYSYVQESIDLDCDIWVNKGDLIGIYNANVYTGKSLSGDQIDALYYQISGEVSSEFDPGDLNGDGISGLLMYARSDKTQDKLVLDVDFGNRVNVEDINITGSVENITLEYNLARCLDINWSIDLFNEQHKTGYYYIGSHPTYIDTSPSFYHNNVAYGIGKLSDGVLTVKDGYNGAGYSVGTSDPTQGGDTIATFVPTDPQYFFVNGDQEWLGVYQHKKSSTVSAPFVQEFNEDPIAFTLLFPYGLNKTIYKSVIYFKEKWNFRNFGLSVTTNLDDVLGDADDGRFYYIEEYSAVTMDNQRIVLDGDSYESVDEYLFVNPCHGEPIFEFSGARGANGEYLGEVANYSEYSQASNLDWTYLAHEFGPIECKGFRFYCDYHYSTKITEMELYCRVDDLGSNMVGAMSVNYSYYEELWWQASLEQDSNTEVTAFIGDTPRYFTIEIEPITEMTLSEVVFNIKEDDLYVGEKGCEYQVLPINSKVETTNEAQVVEVKNIYNSDYDLYVDIAQDSESDDRLIYHSRMNNAASITNPEIGPDGIYDKSDDYPLLGDYKNCAINNDCWGLRNLIDGKQSYYSHDNGYTWHEFSTLASGVSVDFSNVTASNMTIISFPAPAAGYRYWKIGWKALDHQAMNVREMTPFSYTGTIIDPNDDFIGYDGEAPNLTRWSLEGNPYILNNKLYLYEAAGERQDLRSNFVLDGDFDIEYTFAVINYENVNTWKIVLKVIDNEGNIIQIQRQYSGGNDSFYAYQYISEVGSGFGTVYEGYIDGKLKLTRSGDTFDAWAWYNSTWHHVGSTTETVEQSMYVWIYAESTDSNPIIETYIDDFVVNTGTAEIRQDLEMPCTFYHDKELAFEDGPITDTAPHLQNDSVTGSYYKLEGGVNILQDGANIGMDFAASEKIDKIIWFHDAIDDYDATYCGIDKYTELNIVGKDGSIVDYSYDERTVTTVGSGIYVDTNGRFDITVNELTATNGLYGADSSPTNTTIPLKATLVDGELYPTYADNTCICTSNNSVGIDLGASKTVNKLGFYGSTDNIGEPWQMHTGSWDPFHVYKSNDNITWTLVRTYNVEEFSIGFPALVTTGGISEYRHGYFEFLFDGPQSARYFKLWCENTVQWSYGGYTSKNVWINEIKAYVDTPDATSETGIRFSGHSDSYISVPPSSDFVFPGDTYAPVEGDFDAFTIDFYVKFNSLPANDGDYCTLLRNWSDEITTSLGTYTFPPDRSLHNTRVETNDYGWPAVNYAIFVRNVSGTCYIEFWTQTKDPWGFLGGGYMWSRGSNTVYDKAVVVGETYHISFERQEPPDETPIYYYINGLNYCQYGMIGQRSGLSPYCQTIKIGNGLDGWMSDIRITKGLRRIPPRDGLAAAGSHAKRTDVDIGNERYYTMSLYTSNDNVTYNKYADIDLYYDNSYSHHSANSIFSSDYYSYLAIDLETSYDLDWIRSYGSITNRYELSFYGENSENIYYSNDNLDDVEQVTWTGRDDYENEVMLRETEWSGWTSGTVTYAPISFTAVNCTGLTKENGLFVMDFQYSESDPGDFDKTRGIRIEITSTGAANLEEWYYTVFPPSIDGWVEDVWYTIYVPLSLFSSQGGELDVSNINYIRITGYLQSGGYGFYIYCRNAKVFWDIVEAATIINDVRWLRIGMLSGDGTTRTLRKIGLYPDIDTQLSPAGGSYNHEWDYLGKSITAYGSSTNLALGATTSGGATVSGSSYFGMMYFDNITDGVVNSSADTSITEEESSFYDVWGSINESTPWILIDLGATYSVYRFKIYHGYDGADTEYIITDYSVQTSTDNQTYDTHFTISNNDEFVRTHDLTVPVQVRYVKIAITGYDSERILLRTDLEGSTLAYFDGAVIREVEVYEYYGYSVISSEEYPVVAVNLNDQFYLSSHSIVGIDSEDSSTDWRNYDTNFCYADSVLNNPSKVDFRAWGGDPYYDQWMVVKMDSATNYRSGPHYLKHVRAEGTYEQNPCDYPWWWQSSVSTISRDFIYEVVNAASSLKIEYPASTTIDDISFIEGDHFSTDTLASWRDGFSFRIRIDDVDNLDKSFGYFHLGGYDASSGANPIDYKWYISTLSGSLTSGWNDLFLRFKHADEIEYIEGPRTDDDLRIISTINLAKIGMRYRGIGNALTMHVDGFKIERNRFYDYSGADVGCYLSNNDYITAPIGEYDMSRGAMEFWFRPDYDYDATDYYGAMRNRAIFSFNNNTNDVFGFMVGYNGLEIYFGNAGQTLNILSLSDLGVSILDVMFHVGIVFSNDGKQIDNDGSTVRLYFNGLLVFKATNTWEVLDNKHFVFVLGGTAPLNLKAGTYIETSSVDAVISDFKIYNYCKTDFYNSIRNVTDKADKLIKPSNFIEISKDNLTYYEVGDIALPLVYENVSSDASVSIYVRTNIPEGLTGKENRTAGLLCYWDISV